MLFSSASWNRFFCDFFRFCSIFSGFGKGFGAQDRGQNRFLGGFFAMLFSTAFWYRFWVVFWRAEPLKISIFPRENNDFYKIGVSEKVAKNRRFRLHFRRSKRRKIDTKRCWKTRIFFNFDFFAFFAILARFWEARGLPKIWKKTKKSKKIDFWTRSVLKEGSGRILGGFWERFWSDFGGILVDFGRIWGRFLKLLGRIWVTNND